MKSTLNLEYFEKKDQSHSLSITEINNCKTSSYLSVQKAILFSLESREFTATSSKADISKTENFFSIFYCFNEIYVKFRVFWKKRSAS